MRQISLEGMKQLFKQEAEDVFLTIITITHPDLEQPLRYVNDTVNLEFEEATYTALPFRFVLPPDIKDKQPTARIELDNINRDLINLIRTVEQPPTLEVSIVRKPSSGTPVREIGPFTFRMLNIKYNVVTLSADLGFNADFLNESATADYFTPNIFPGLF